jgi:DDE superfamily endonuclease/Helix-turn-helix of DDE superfamily endonuclease
MLSYDTVKQHPGKFLSCTSLTPDEFTDLLVAFTAAWNIYAQRTYVNSGGGKPKLPRLEDKLFFILYYYKVYPIQTVMGAVFDMSQSQVSYWVGVLSPILQQSFGYALCLPETRQKHVKEALEACDMYDFIIDGTERERQRPGDPDEQKAYYSGKNKTYTYNNILIVDANTKTVAYLSPTYEGTWHDKAICDAEAYVFPDNATLQKDRGFQGYEPQNVITYQPKKKPRGEELPLIDKLINRVLSSSRITIEHVICGIKRLHIVKDIYRNRRDRLEDIIMEIACAMHNFRHKHRSQEETIDMFAMI